MVAVVVVVAPIKRLIVVVGDAGLAADVVTVVLVVTVVFVVGVAAGAACGAANWAAGRRTVMKQ